MKTMQNFQAGSADLFIQTVASKMSKAFIETIQEQGFNPAIIDVATLQEAIISEYMKNILCCVYDKRDYDNIRITSITREVFDNKTSDFYTIDGLEYVKLVAFGRTLMRESSDYVDRCFLIYLNILVGDYFGMFKLADEAEDERNYIVSEVIRITPYANMKAKYELSKNYYTKFGTGDELRQLETNFKKLKALYNEMYNTEKSETNDGAK
jgi:hypothetical protein|nr:MAG TPA: hypothetical protein [Caudoviricetes sp.]